MIGPYWMVFVNGILSLLILAGVFTYIYIYPKKRINYLLLFGLISLLPAISILRKGVYESGDFVYHLYRAMDFADALKDGVFIPSWAAHLNNNYGYPVFL